MTSIRKGVVVVGSCNTDLVAYCAVLPKNGETVMGKSFSASFGGKGANQMVMAANMGIATAMVACLGTDSFGDDYMANLKTVGVDTTCCLRTGEASTGVAQICVGRNGQNTVVIVPGANLLLTPQHIREHPDIKRMITSATVLLCQLEVQLETTMAALELAKGAGVTTVFNPAPATAELPDEIYRYCDFIAPNETELQILCPGVDTESIDSITKGAKDIIGKGAANVIITLGERGALWVSTGNDDGGDGEEAVRLFPIAETVQAVDTVGAGDAFLGALAAYLSAGIPVESAIPKACEVASMSVLKQGAQSSYPNVDSLPPHLQIPTKA